MKGLRVNSATVSRSYLYAMMGTGLTPGRVGQHQSHEQTQPLSPETVSIYPLAFPQRPASNRAAGKYSESKSYTLNPGPKPENQNPELGTCSKLNLLNPRPARSLILTTHHSPLTTHPYPLNPQLSSPLHPPRIRPLDTCTPVGDVSSATTPRTLSSPSPSPPSLIFCGQYAIQSWHIRVSHRAFVGGGGGGASSQLLCAWRDV
eukprot:1598395-Rhodomonas_salina.2